MIDLSSTPITVKSFGGGVSLPDPAEIPPNVAQIARNMQYIGDQAATRYGFGEAFIPGSPSDAPITSMYNWISSLGNYLIYYEETNHRLRISNISATPGTPTTLASLNAGGYGAISASAGARVYHATFDTTGRGVDPGVVTTFQSSAFVSDFTFLGPLTYTPGPPTEPGVGSITAGLHRIGYQIEYRSGFITRPSPDSGAAVPSPQSFLPITYTATGGRNCAVTLNTTWPSAAVAVWLVFSPTTDLAQYIQVPGSRTPVSGGSTSSITITFSISDNDLLADPNVNQVTNALNFLTQSAGGVSQIKPYFTTTHGNRMVYLTTILDNAGNASCAAFLSNIGAYEEIAADLSLIQLPGLLDITCARSCNGYLYFFGPHWTFGTQDNGGDPVTWPAPVLIDGRRGTLAIRGVDVGLGGGLTPEGVLGQFGNYLWVADTTGLYMFRGIYTDLPISFNQTPDWNRINWNYAHTVQVKDNTDEKKVVVYAPLDNATTPSHMLTWDYTNGMDYDKARYSLDTINNFSGSAIEIVQNTLTGLPAQVFKRKELWVSPLASPGIVERGLSAFDTNPYRDNGVGIDFQYRTGPFRSTGLPHIQLHQGGHCRLRGAGNLDIKNLSIDNAVSVGPVSIPLSLTPGPDFLRLFQFLSEGAAYDFAPSGGPTADTYMILSYLRHYLTTEGMQAA